MATVTAEEMRGKLLTLDTVRERLAETEPLSRTPLEDATVAFRFTPGWNADLDLKGDTTVVDVGVTVNGNELQMTKEAVLQATAAAGLTSAFVRDKPSVLVEPVLNWAFTGQNLDKNYQIFGKDGQALAVAKATISPFSNVRLMNEAIDSIVARYGSSDLLVDYKMVHDLRKTHLRIIVPDHVRVMSDTGTDDDRWSVGIQLKNSLTGAGQTSIDGYLFRWWCTNGAIDTHSNSGTWSRKGGGQGEDVYDWARVAVDEVLGGLEHSLDAVQALALLPVNNEIQQVLRDIFEQFGIPAAERRLIIQNLAEITDRDLTMYDVMNAITQVANSLVDPAHVSRLLAAGGDLPHSAADRCESCHRISQ